MKRILLPFMLILLALLSVTINTFAQQSFDIIDFKAPASWEQTNSDAGIRFMKEDATKAIDILRVGRAREKKIALAVLKKEIVA